MRGACECEGKRKERILGKGLFGKKDPSLPPLQKKPEQLWLALVPSAPTYATNRRYSITTQRISAVTRLLLDVLFVLALVLWGRTAWMKTLHNHTKLCGRDDHQAEKFKCWCVFRFAGFSPSAWTPPGRRLG